MITKSSFAAAYHAAVNAPLDSQACRDYDRMVANHCRPVDVPDNVACIDHPLDECALQLDSGPLAVIDCTGMLSFYRYL